MPARGELAGDKVDEEFCAQRLVAARWVEQVKVLGTRPPVGKHALRQAFNHWIRTEAKLDAVVDFDAVLRDPRHPSRLLPKYDSGDHLHPGDAGYAAMAKAIDIR